MFLAANGVWSRLSNKREKADISPEDSAATRQVAITDAGCVFQPDMWSTFQPMPGDAASARGGFLLRFGPNELPTLTAAPADSKDNG